MLTFAILTAITIGLVEVIKRTGTPIKFLPLIAVLVGIVLNFFGDISGGAGFGGRVIIGIAIGLSASGLFDQTKLLKNKK